MLRRQFMTGAMASAIVTPCMAHHTFAMFDSTRSVTLHGTVKELQWTNPHCFLEVLVPTEDTVAQWSIEMHSPLLMYQAGWRPGIVKPGDKITVVISPMKDGRNGGSLISAVAASGKTLSTTRPRS
jgi:hypothetical protein